MTREEYKERLRKLRSQLLWHQIDVDGAANELERLVDELNVVIPPAKSIIDTFTVDNRLRDMDLEFRKLQGEQISLRNDFQELRDRLYQVEADMDTAGACLRREVQ